MARELVTAAQVARELGIAPQTAQGALKGLGSISVNGRPAYWRDDAQTLFEEKNEKLLRFLGYLPSLDLVADEKEAETA